MTRKAEPAYHTRALRAGLHGSERNALVHFVALDTIESPNEIKMPPRAAQFTVGDRLQADFFLLSDNTFDFAVFESGQLGSAELSPAPTRARLFECGGAQQAAHMISPERRPGALHSIPTPRLPLRRSSATSSTARFRSARCRPRWRQSRIVVRGRAGRYQRISPLRRCAAAARRDIRGCRI